MPSLIALVAIPMCVRAYGEEQFGLLSLGWTFIVAFAYLDLGLGVSTTKYTAEVLRQNEVQMVPKIIWSSLGVQFIAGILFASIVVTAAPLVAERIIAAPRVLEDEAIAVVRYTGLSIPFITMSAALRSVLEASNRFNITNAIKIPSSSLLFLFPGLGALTGLSVSSVVLLLAISRVGTAVTLFFFTAKLYPDILRNISFEFSQARTLLKFGGWVSISTLLNPVIHHGEKLLIPSLLTVGALSYYSPPLDVVARIGVIPFSMAIALLPKFSYLGIEEMQGHREHMLTKPIKYLLLIMTPIAAFLIFFAHEIISVWLGSAFIDTSGDLLALFALAYFFNAFAYVAFSAIQGLGFPELKAFLDLVLAPVFLVGCWFALSGFGLAGVAMIKAIVLALDAICLFWILKTILRIPARTLFPSEVRLLGILSLLVVFGGMAAHVFIVSVALRLVLFGCALAVLGIVFVRVASSKEELLSIREAFADIRPVAHGEQLRVGEGDGSGRS